MKTALVHDYLFEYGGAERVLEALHEIWPKAPVYTAWVDWDWVKKNKKSWLTWKIVPSWFQKFPFHKQLCSPLRFLTPWIWESFDFSDYDLVISSSAWYISKGILTPPSTTHICYCHTPPRYLYGYPQSIKKNALVRLYASLVNPFMRHYDYLSAQRVDHFVCNSENVRKRVKKFYQREAKVIYPPVEIPNELTKDSKKGNYYLMVNRLVWHKRVDLSIKACQKLGLNLKVVGQGRAEEELKKIAGNDKNIEFLGYVSDERLGKLYQHCKAVLYLAEEEDFGITPVEANAYGKPVVALRSGGIPEAVVEGKTGVFINKPDLKELIKVLKSFDNSGYKLIKAKDCFFQALRFSQERFKKEIKNFAQSRLKSNNES